MLRLTLRQARGTAGRLVAAGLAIVLGTAFVTTVLLADTLMKRTIFSAVSSNYSGADVVIAPVGDQPLTSSTVDRVRELSAVKGVDGRRTVGVVLALGDRSEYLDVVNLPATPALRVRAVEAGALPSAPGEVALPVGTADRLGVSIGSRLTVRGYSAPSTDGQPASGTAVRVTGLVDQSASSLGAVIEMIGWPTDVQAWAAADAAATGNGAGGSAYETVLVVAKAGTSPQALSADVATALAGTDASVRTADEVSAEAVDGVTGGTDVLAGIVAAFAVLALFVAGIVITNTFAVLVAQRTRQLALLRCVGATAGQVRRGVLTEALALGVVASVVGVAAGTAIAALAARVLAAKAPGIPVPPTIEPSLLSVLVPVALGALATVVAALAPARAATRVSPLAALRPAVAPDLRTSASLQRLLLALGLLAFGALSLAGGVALALAGYPGGLPFALAGGAMSFIGIMVGAVFIVPRVVGAGGRLAATVGGGPARVAAANAVRNPRRTAATTTALLIGVTLVTLMSVGATCARATLDGALAGAYPVDVAVGSDPSVPVTAADGEGTSITGPAPLPTGTRRAVAGVHGVARVAALRSAVVTASTPAGAASLVLEGVDPAAARSVLAAPSIAAPLTTGVVVVPEAVARQLQLTSGQALALTAGTVTRELRVQVTSLPGGALLATTGDLAALAPSAPLTRLWVALDEKADAASVVSDVQTAVGGGDRAVVVGDTAPADVTSDVAPAAAPEVSGAAVQRASYERVIDTMLLVVIALLAVAVVISLIGVANTLSLSVIERTRESAVMRALGLTRGQLRGMLALEGALMAGAAGVLGVGLGAVYGWAGATSLLGPIDADTIGLALPWGQLGLTVVVAIVAGLLASVLPARRAVRTPAVVALAE